jgi:Cupin domain
MKWLAPSTMVAMLCVATPMPGHAEDAMMLVNPDQMKWGPVDVIPGAKSAVLSGDPSKQETFILEVQWPAGSKIGPHWHSNTERVAIVSGTGVVGMGDNLDPQKGMPITPGGYVSLPGKMHHWFVAQSPVVMLITGEGPFDITFINPEDDPRKKPSKQ